jgi:hypothetical protein
MCRSAGGFGWARRTCDGDGSSVGRQMRRPPRTRRSQGARRSWRAFRSGEPWRSGWSLRADCPWRPRRALRACQPLWPGWSLRAGRPLRPRGSRRTLRSCCSGRSLRPAARHQSRYALAASLHLQDASGGILLALPTECSVRPGIQLDAAARADFYNDLRSARLDPAADPKASASDLCALNGDCSGSGVDGESGRANN